jgi:hypothetical protein
MHLDRGHHAAEKSSLFNSILQSDGIDDSREHAHVIGGHPVHVDRLLGHAAEEVTTSDDDADLAAKCVNVCDLLGYFVNENGVDTEASACGQGFSGELEEDSFVHVRSKYRMGLEG